MPLHSSLVTEKDSISKKKKEQKLQQKTMKLKTEDTWRKTNKTKSWFFKIDKSVARLTNIKKEKKEDTNY